MLIKNPEEKLYKFCPKCSSPLKYKKRDGKKRLICPKCDFVLWSNPKPTVTVVVSNNKGGILMTRRARTPFKGWWCLPGGFVEYQESPEDAARREIQEEVGTKIKNLRLLGVYQIDNDPRGVHIDIIYYAEISGKAQLSKEVTEFKFFNRKSLPKRIAFRHREASVDYFNLT